MAYPVIDRTEYTLIVVMIALSGQRGYMTTARVLMTLAVAIAFPVLIASITLGVWLISERKSIAGQIVLLCMAAAAAATQPLLLAFAAGMKPQAAAFHMHAESLKTTLQECPEDSS